MAFGRSRWDLVDAMEEHSFGFRGCGGGRLGFWVHAECSGCWEGGRGA